MLRLDIVAIVSVHDLTPLAWPLVVGGAVALMFATRSGRKLLGRVSRVKVGQVQLEAGGENAAEVKATLEDAFRENREKMTRQINKEVGRFRIKQHRDAVATEVLQQLAGSSGFRCTVHIPDILFDGPLYCLLDYWPKGTAAGKVYSERYGIIGRAWRLRASCAQTVVKGDRQILLSEWGMTEEEAAGHTEDRSFLAVVLKREDDPHDPVGILFADGPPDTFKQEHCAAVEQSSETQLLVDSVAKLLAVVRTFATDLKVLER
jgi:hypothetical protein